MAKQKHSFFDYPYPIPFAHRGGNELYPENTMAAFRHAYSLGYRYLETDVHYTAGHELVAFHDTELLRTAGVSGKIANLTVEQRKHLLFDGKHPIPLLAELLETFPDAYFNIDAKSPAAIEPLVKVLKKHAALDRVCVTSFSRQRLKQLRVLVPGTPTSTTTFESIALRSRLGRRRLLHAESRYLEIPAHAFVQRKRVPLVNQRFVERLHKHGHKVYIWTVNDEDEMVRLLDMGVDGLFTDKVSLLKQLLQSRGQWLI